MVGNLADRRMKHDDESRGAPESGTRLTTGGERVRRMVADYGAEIGRYLARIGVPEPEVDDVAQEVFLIASSKLDVVQPEGDRPFLYAIASRVAHNARRARARRRKVHERFVSDVVSDPCPTPEELFDELRARVLVDSVLREMPRELQRVLVMCEVDGMAIPEIAQRLALPTGTATSRLRRARETFADRATRMRGARGRRDGAWSREGPEILSWWVSDGEVDALRALLDIYRRSNPGATVLHGGIRDTSAAKSRLGARMARGAPPDTFQANGGQDLLKWAGGETGLQPIEFLFEEEGWRDAFPREVLDLVTRGGEAFAVPLNVHCTNAMFYDANALARAGVEVPRSLDELHAAIATLNRRGAPALALGASMPWMLSLLAFENLLVAVAGPQFYRALFEGRGAPRSPELRTAIEELGRLLDAASPESAALSWDGAAERVRIGAAAITIGGDWAKGYLECRGALEGEAFEIAPSPGTNGSHVFTTDTFGLPSGAPHREATIELLRVFGSPEGQRVFSRIKGSEPARLDVGPRVKSNARAPRLHDAGEVERVPTLTSIVPPSFSDAMDGALAAFARDRNVDSVLDVMDREYARRGW